jgi:hypothetical protein
LWVLRPSRRAPRPLSLPGARARAPPPRRPPAPRPPRPRPPTRPPPPPPPPRRWWTCSRTASTRWCPAS